MFKKRLMCIVSFFLLLASIALVAGSLVPRQGAHAMRFSANAAASPTSGGTGDAATDSFGRTIASGWGSADTGGWWSVVGSPWSWSVSPGAGSVNIGAGGEERAYLSSFKIQDVDIVEKVVLPRCNGNTNCDAFVLGRYSPAYTPT